MVLKEPAVCSFVSLWSWKKSNVVHFCHFWWMVSKVDFYLCFCEGSWKESQIVHFWLWSYEVLMNGLKMTQIYFSASSDVACHWYLVEGFERRCWGWYSNHFVWLKWTWRHSCITYKWDLTWHSLGVLWWFLFKSWSLQCKKKKVLKWLFQVVLKFQLDAAMVYQPPVIVTFKIDLGSFQESCFWVTILI